MFCCIDECHRKASEDYALVANFFSSRRCLNLLSIMAVVSDVAKAPTHLVNELEPLEIKVRMSTRGQ